MKWLIDLIRKIFGGNSSSKDELPPPEEKRIMCPRCLTNLAFTPALNTCPECNYIFPVMYKQHFEKAAPMFLQVFGWTQHGKSMFLDVLRIMLMESMYAFWPDYSHGAATDLDQQHENILRLERQNGLPPGATPKRDRSQNEVYITRLQNMERWGSRQMVIMDQPGENFETMEKIPAEEIPYLVGTRTTFMMISLSDIDEARSSGNIKGGTSIDQLLQNYITTMARFNVDLSEDRRNLIVVLTKADKLDSLPANLRNYLELDEVYQASVQTTDNNLLQGVKLSEYIEKLDRVSKAIEQWLQADPFPQRLGGRAFVRIARQNNIHTRYTLISATGQDIDQGGVQIAPRRVLDPFFWALELQSY